MSISVVIVEDNRDFRLGTEMVLRASPDCHCSGTFESAEQFLQQIDVLRPSVVLMDIGLPGISGIEAVNRVLQKRPETQIVMISAFEDDDNIFAAICAGACGYVAKPVAPQQLLDIVGQAARKESPMSPHIARKVLRMFQAFAPPPSADYQLSKREKEVLTALTDGKDFKEIAEVMCVSPYTIRAHIRNIYEKLQVHSKSEAVAKALKENLV